MLNDSTEYAVEYLDDLEIDEIEEVTIICTIKSIAVGTLTYCLKSWGNFCYIKKEGEKRPVSFFVVVAR